MWKLNLIWKILPFFFGGQEASLALYKKAAEQRIEAIKAKTPKPIIKENPATTKSIMHCTLKPITKTIFLYLFYR